MCIHNNVQIKVYALDKLKRRVIRTGIVEYEKAFGRHNLPWRQCNHSAFDVLIAEILLKRTTASAVSRIYLSFLQEFPSSQALYLAYESEIAIFLSGIGLQQQRAKLLKEIADYLTRQERGSIPSKLTDLLNIPGVGDYTARAIQSFAFDIPVAILDSNVERILLRVFQNTVPYKPNRSLLQSIVDQLVPKSKHKEFNFGLLDLGAAICRYRNPIHSKCPLQKICDYYHNLSM
jgi:A/G-specific adenine glycosylase